MINNISKESAKTRLQELNKETPMIWTTSFIKSPQEITALTAARNNIMLDTVVANQKTIIENQNKIIEKLEGKNLDTIV